MNYSGKLIINTLELKIMWDSKVMKRGFLYGQKFCSDGTFQRDTQERFLTKAA